MQCPKFFPKSPQVKEVLRPEDPEDNKNSLVKLIANVVEWGKWDVNMVLDSPFVPLMVIVDAVLEQQKKASDEAERNVGTSGETTELDGDFADKVLNNPNQYK